MATGHMQTDVATAQVQLAADAEMVIVIEEQVEVPMRIRCLEDFRRWVVSDEFPERGRIDYVAGRIEVDMSPEDLFCHGKLKGELARILLNRVDSDDRGHLFIDRARISCPAAALSAEPDIVFISHGAVDEARVRLVPKAGRRKGRYIEIEGPPELVVEIVSDSSVKKDTSGLPAAYWKAGVREFWLADGRGDDLLFVIHERGEQAFKPVPLDNEGFQFSAVMGCRYRLQRTESHGQWRYRLTERTVA
jgi:Uma2 family endonuclease